MESFQYHPTGIAWPPHLAGTLISEAARAAGGLLFNGEGKRFVDELAPRDVVAAAILREIEEGRAVERDGCAGVLLDTPGLEAANPGILEKRLVTLTHLAGRSGFDPRREPFLLRPTLHYQNGGIAIDAAGRTDVPGLLCAGEAAGGLHGLNRLMGNALLELVAFGRRAGTAAAEAVREDRPRGIGLTHLAAWERGLVGAGLPLDSRAPMIFPPYGNVDLAAMLRRRPVNA
jgi:succinate dehydrogenase / fumarate reductase flavoprotein subunit/L-aspartate oxidase